MVSEAGLRDEVDSIAAAAGRHINHVADEVPISRKAWLSAAAVIVDGRSAGWEAVRALPRRSDVFMVSGGSSGDAPPDADVLTGAIAIGAQRVFVLPGQADGLVGALSRLEDGTGALSPRGPVAAVIGGRGGAGASLFASAVALSAKGSLLVDLDAHGGGIDLVVGSESATGLRWPDVALQDGRISWSAVRAALPRHRGISVLSGSRQGHDIAVGAVDAVLEAGRVGGATVVCDLPRHLSGAARSALDIADLVVVVATCDVRSCAATAALVPTLTSVNPNVGLVVRGPAPGGLRPGEVAEIVGVPLLAAMRPEPMIAEKLECGGLRFRPRSPLAVAARHVLAVLAGSPAAPRERAA